MLLRQFSPSLDFMKFNNIEFKSDIAKGTCCVAFSGMLSIYSTASTCIFSNPSSGGN